MVFSKVSVSTIYVYTYQSIYLLFYRYIVDIYIDVSKGNYLIKLKFYGFIFL